ncbi:WD40 repeat-like protein [Coprinopsis marcescibilis]|uniref:WD40 repeat-like protein n=1 Tax=Coprinopsis marcescibilis TaxID=230819 RepID=A0A5C3LCD4_COPMA|nr:WD40 repeat-like protein [Coprinopsis marcescibilis]
MPVAIQPVRHDTKPSIQATDLSLLPSSHFKRLRMSVTMDDLAAAATDDVEELAWKLLSKLPRARLAAVQRRIHPLLQFDVVGTLPIELALQIFSHLTYQTLLTCNLVSKRWRTLANDQALWKELCQTHRWAWRRVHRPQPLDHLPLPDREWDHSDDEGMGDSDSDSEDHYINSIDDAKVELSMMYAELDSGFASSSTSVNQNSTPSIAVTKVAPKSSAHLGKQSRHSAPSIFGVTPDSFRKPDFKLLHQTHIRLRNRFISSSYRLSPLQTRGTPLGGHTNTIYCLQLYTEPETGRQLLFTGSRDKTVRQWCLTSSRVERVISGFHTSSVLSLCAHNGYLASAGSDRRVVLWDLKNNRHLKTICDHEDSVLCVRFDNQQLVSCSKDRTVRSYSFPDLKLRFVLDEHRAAVNAVSISDSYIVSGSGDRSIRLWDSKTGKLLRTFDNHHSRGIASISFNPPLILSGSSDKHLRVFDITTLRGWSTSPEYDRASATGAGTASAALPVSLASDNSYPNDTSVHAGFPLFACQNCGGDRGQLGGTAVIGIRQDVGGDGSAIHRLRNCTHGNLVRTVSLGDDFVISGSYDLTIKVWDKRTGALVADLTGGHTGRIFCVDFDRTKIVSCGEDQRICVWDFAHGIDTSFVQLS